MRDELADLQARLGAALAAADPVAALRAQLPGLAVDEAGFRMTALLVAKLRFQRLMNASREATDWFEQDPAGFTASFRRYHHEVPSPALDPWGEAAAFARWRELHER